MSYFGKIFRHYKDEHFEEFLDTLGLPQDKIPPILDTCPTQKIEKNGEEYIFTSDIDGKRMKEIKFRSGVEFDEKVTDTLTAKTTFTVDGNVITQVQKFPDGRSLITERQYTGEDLLVILRSSFWDGLAHRYYSTTNHCEHQHSHSHSHSHSH